MLAFPTAPAEPSQRWKKALVSTRPAGASNAKLGRTATEVIPRLYLSDYFSATDGDTLKKYGITHVISVIETPPPLPEWITEERRLHVSLQDKGEEDLLGRLDDTTEFISAALKEKSTNKVLVHCFQGISRSATVICAYLIATRDMTMIQSIEFVQAKRGIVCPNNGFRIQLQTYSERFVGGRGAKRKGEAPAKRRLSIGKGIADRVRRLKRSSASSANESMSSVSSMSSVAEEATPSLHDEVVYRDKSNTT